MNSVVQYSGRRLSVDHNHVTSKVRGLLCNNCNRGIGNFKDKKELLLKAISYLDKHEILAEAGLIAA